MGHLDRHCTFGYRPYETLSIAEEPGDYYASDTPSAPAEVADPDGPPDASPLHRQGEALRVAMALLNGASAACEDRQANAADLRARMFQAAGSPDAPTSDTELTARLHRLARTGDRALAEQLRLLPRFDDAQLWKAAGCSDCIMWMDRHLRVRRNAAFERLRMARALQSLPFIESLFALGKLSYSQVRELTRVADADCELELVAAVTDLSVSETAALCQRWRFGRRDADDCGEDGQSCADEREAADALRAFEERSVTLRDMGRGRGRICIDLPLDLFAEVVKVLECMEDQLREGDREPETPADGDSPVAPRSARQYRADALVHMSRRGLAHEGEAIAKADRYRVLLAAPVSVLGASPQTPETPETPETLDAERPQLIGFGPIAHATARRLAETATMTVLATLVNGEVIGVTHDTRMWPRPMVRAITARDRCCQMPGCTRTRFGQAHHVVTVADGGRTTITNAALICSSCHRSLHEGGFQLERVTADEIDLGEAADSLPMSEAQRMRSRERIARVQGFRLLRADGTVVAGPRRLSDRVSTQQLDDDERILRLLSAISANSGAVAMA